MLAENETHHGDTSPGWEGNTYLRMRLRSQGTDYRGPFLNGLRVTSYLGNYMRAGMLGSRGNDGAPMTKRLAKKLDNNRLGGHVLSPSQEPLPPYELDPMLDNPVIRNRIGELIAKAAEKRFGGWSLRCR